jgi:hypothetical protein
LAVYSRLLDAGSLAQTTDTRCDIGMDGNRKVYECIIGINILKSNEDGFFKIFFLLLSEDEDFIVLFWSASSDRPCM